MSFLRTSNSLLKKNFLLNKFLKSNNGLFKINVSSFSNLNKHANDILKNEKTSSTENKLFENKKEERANEEKDSNKNDLNNYIEYIKKRDYKPKAETESFKKRFFEKFNFKYIRYINFLNKL
jgi:hypothetical protein